MYYGKKKWIIIIIIIVLILALVAVGGYFVYAKTDLFKSSKSLFWKYASSQMEDLKKISPDQLASIEKAKSETPYTVDSEVTFDSDNSDASKILNKLKLNVKGEYDKPENYAHTYSKLDYDNTKIFDFHYINSNDLFALKAEEIITVYLGVRNENLNVLAQKLGIPASGLPNELPIVGYSELFNVSDAQISTIFDTYKDVVLNNIKDEDYSKQTAAVIKIDNASYDTTSYRLDLSAAEQLKIAQEILTKMKTDSVVLDLLATRFTILDLQQYNSVEGVKDLIDNILNNISEDNFNDISFVVYNYEGRTIATEIIMKNDVKITLNSGVGKLKLTFEDLKGRETLENVGEKLELNIDYSFAAASSQIKVNVKLDDEEIVNVLATTIGSVAQSKVQTDVSATYTIKNATNTISKNTTNTSSSSLLNSSNSLDSEDVNIDEDDTILPEENNKIDFAYTQIIEFVDKIEDKEILDQTNCAVLNDYTQEQISSIMQAISERVVVVLQEKMQTFANIFGSSLDAMSRVDITDSLNEALSEAINQYVGKNRTASTVRTLCDTIISNNQDSSNMQIKVNGTADYSEISSLKDTFLDSEHYEVSADYNDNGLIDSITIKKID